MACNFEFCGILNINIVLYINMYIYIYVYLYVIYIYDMIYYCNTQLIYISLVRWKHLETHVDARSEELVMLSAKRDAMHVMSHEFRLHPGIEDA